VSPPDDSLYAKKRIRQKMINRRLAGAASGALLIVFLALVFVHLPGCGGKQEPRGRVFVLGLDGATYDLIGPWLEDGSLPNLRAFMDSGIYGTLESVIPPMSPPAWASAITGVNPGKHAMFDWYRRLPNTRALVSETSKSLRTKAIWTLLSEVDRPVGAINIPLTDPPHPVNGFMITGMPHTEPTGFTYPPELQGTLDGYMTDSMGDHLDDRNAEELLDKFMRTYSERLKVTIRLMQDRPWDLFWVVFTVTDRVQHYYWKFMDEKHPRHDPSAAPLLKSAIYDMWVEVDRGIGQILEAMPDNVTVIVMSDHGFGPIYKEVRLHNLVRGRDLEGDPICYTDGGIAQLIYIDLQGRLPYGVVPQEKYEETRDHIASLLLNLRDPDTGEAVVDAVYRKEEVYSGRYLSKAPDLVAIEKPFYYMNGDTIPGLDPIGAGSASFNAFHQPDGILAVRGPGIRAGRIDNVPNLIDITPTILYMLGEPVRSYMDGVVIKALFTEEYLSSNDVRFTEEGADLEMEEPEYTDEELEKLKAVPYLR
jgi:predicted AlkP superfamily phosphohydrolase/phosphomutase